jgi:hypothetical protein
VKDNLGVERLERVENLVQLALVRQGASGPPGPPGPTEELVTRVYFNGLTSPLVLGAVGVGLTQNHTAISVLTPFPPGSTVNIGTSATPTLIFNALPIDRVVQYSADELLDFLVADLLIVTFSGVSSPGQGVLIYKQKN